MTKLYKYCGKDIGQKIFSNKEDFSLKFSKLEEFNDPYEFFLTVDYDTSIEMLATYLEMISMQKTFLATCFSKTPISTPMWAHYADTMEGFVLEINEKKLEEAMNLKNTTWGIEDISYKDVSDDNLNALLGRICHIGKPRYVHMFLKQILHNAYFTKQTCWKYEQERRLIISDDLFLESDSIKKVHFPYNIISRIIVGKNISNSLYNFLEKVALRIGVQILKIFPSKITLQPYFINNEKETFLYKNKCFEKSHKYCSICNEPNSITDGKCLWCSVTNQHKTIARYKNPFNQLHDAGLLDDYLKAATSIYDKK